MTPTEKQLDDLEYATKAALELYHRFLLHDDWKQQMSAEMMREALDTDKRLKRAVKIVASFRK